MSKGRVTIDQIAKELPYTMGRELRRKALPPITPELVLKLYQQLYAEWVERRNRTLLGGHGRSVPGGN
jgi:hypothetical protein